MTNTNVMKLVDPDEIEKNKELLSLSFFGHKDAILQPQSWQNLAVTNKDLIGTPYILKPSAKAYQTGNFKYRVVVFPIKLDGSYGDFHSIYVKPSFTSNQQFEVQDAAPDKVNLVVTHTMVKALDATVGGTTPIGITASVTGHLSWQDVYTVDAPLITSLSFNDNTVCWQFERQKAQKIQTGELLLYMTLRSNAEFTGTFALDVVAFDKRPKDADSPGFKKASPFTIDLAAPNNLNNISVDEYLKGSLQTTKMMELLSMWTDLKLDGKKLADLDAK